MKATMVLMQEHRVIERMILVIEIAAKELEDGKAIRPGLFLEAAQFFKGFADGCHHRKEEGVLFKAMEAHGVPVEGGPIQVMLKEHEQGRMLTRGLHVAATWLETGDGRAIPEVVRFSNGYAALLRQHIQKEDRILFPMADEVIPRQKYDEIWDGFEHVEHEETGEGVHEKYLEMVDRLEAEIGG